MIVIILVYIDDTVVTRENEKEVDLEKVLDFQIWLEKFKQANVFSGNWDGQVKSMSWNLVHIGICFYWG